MTLKGLDLDRLSDSGERNLTSDLARAGYLRGQFDEHGGPWATWFQIELVLSRPGLLTRCAAVLHGHLPENVDRLAARGSCAVALATAMSTKANIPLLFCTDGDGDGVRVGGDLFPGARVVLIEDVVLTGQHALSSISGLRAAGLDVVGLLALLDREEQGRFRIEEDETITTFFAFREGDLQ